jgi:hypothetical protein
MPAGVLPMLPLLLMMLAALVLLCWCGERMAGFGIPSLMPWLGIPNAEAEKGLLPDKLPSLLPELLFGLLLLLFTPLMLLVATAAAAAGAPAAGLGMGCADCCGSC